tara:strand:- start:243 stop:353 length:111 start_codon:yes stop_codon:yes gene_type:complete
MMPEEMWGGIYNCQNDIDKKKIKKEEGDGAQQHLSL